MSLNWQWGFSNTATLSKSMPITDLSLTRNYALTEETAKSASLVNKDTSFEDEEHVTFTCRDINRVDTNLNVVTPSGAKGVMYGVTYEAIRKTIDTQSSSQTPISTEPVVVNISLRHPKTDHWDTDAITALQRAVSALYYVLNEGGTGSAVELKSRIPDLMRSQERPIADTTYAS